MCDTAGECFGAPPPHQLAHEPRRSWRSTVLFDRRGVPRCGNPSMVGPRAFAAGWWLSLTPGEGRQAFQEGELTEEQFLTTQEGPGSERWENTCQEAVRCQAEEDEELYKEGLKDPQLRKVSHWREACKRHMQRLQACPVEKAPRGITPAEVGCATSKEVAHKQRQMLEHDLAMARKAREKLERARVHEAHQKAAQEAARAAREKRIAEHNLRNSGRKPLLECGDVEANPGPLTCPRAVVVDCSLARKFVCGAPFMPWLDQCPAIEGGLDPVHMSQENCIWGQAAVWNNTHHCSAWRPDPPTDVTKDGDVEPNPGPVVVGCLVAGADGAGWLCDSWPGHGAWVDFKQLRSDPMREMGTWLGAPELGGYLMLAFLEMLLILTMFMLKSHFVAALKLWWHHTFALVWRVVFSRAWLALWAWYRAWQFKRLKIMYAPINVLSPTLSVERQLYAVIGAVSRREAIEATYHNSRYADTQIGEEEVMAYSCLRGIQAAYIILSHSPATQKAQAVPHKLTRCREGECVESRECWPCVWSAMRYILTHPPKCEEPCTTAPVAEGSQKARGAQLKRWVAFGDEGDVDHEAAVTAFQFTAEPHKRKHKVAKKTTTTALGKDTTTTQLVVAKTTATQLKRWQALGDEWDATGDDWASPVVVEGPGRQQGYDKKTGFGQEAQAADNAGDLHERSGENTADYARRGADPAGHYEPWDDNAPSEDEEEENNPDEFFAGGARFKIPVKWRPLVPNSHFLNGDVAKWDAKEKQMWSKRFAETAVFVRAYYEEEIADAEITDLTERGNAGRAQELRRDIRDTYLGATEQMGFRKVDSKGERRPPWLLAAIQCGLTRACELTNKVSHSADGGNSRYSIANMAPMLVEGKPTTRGGSKCGKLVRKAEGKEPDLVIYHDREHGYTQLPRSVANLEAQEEGDRVHLEMQQRLQAETMANPPTLEAAIGVTNAQLVAMLNDVLATVRKEMGDAHKATAEAIEKMKSPTVADAAVVAAGCTHEVVCTNTAIADKEAELKELRALVGELRAKCNAAEQAAIREASKADKVERAVTPTPKIIHRCTKCDAEATSKLAKQRARDAADREEAYVCGYCRQNNDTSKPPCEKCGQRFQYTLLSSDVERELQVRMCTECIVALKRCRLCNVRHLSQEAHCKNCGKKTQAEGHAVTSGQLKGGDLCHAGPNCNRRQCPFRHVTRGAAALLKCPRPYCRGRWGDVLCPYDHPGAKEDDCRETPAQHQLRWTRFRDNAGKIACKEGIKCSSYVKKTRFVIPASQGLKSLEFDTCPYKHVADRCPRGLHCEDDECANLHPDICPVQGCENPRCHYQHNNVLQLARVTNVVAEGPVPHSQENFLRRVAVFLVFESGLTHNAFMMKRNDRCWFSTARHRTEGGNLVSDGAAKVGEELYVRLAYNNQVVKTRIEAVHCEESRDEIWYATPIVATAIHIKLLTHQSIRAKCDEASKHNPIGCSMLTYDEGAWHEKCGVLKSWDNAEAMCHSMGTSDGFCRSPIALSTGDIVGGHWLSTPAMSAFKLPPQNINAWRCSPWDPSIYPGTPM